MKDIFKKKVVMISVIALVVLAFAIIVVSEDSGSGYTSKGWVSTALYSSAGQGSGFSSLFYDYEDQQTKRAESERELREYFGGAMPGSTEYWTDQMCSNRIPMTGGGAAYTVDADNIVLLAYVTGERQTFTQINEDEDTGDITETEMYLYKLAIKASNRDNKNETLSFNVYVDSTKLYNETIELEDGKTFNRVDGNIEIRVSENLYETICIKFIGRPLVVRDGASYKSLDELCNRIVEVEGTPTNYFLPDYAEIEYEEGEAPADNLNQQANNI